MTPTTTTKLIVIAGCGALGSRIAVELSRPGIILNLYDRDKVEDDNIGTSAYDRFDIGRQKAGSLAAIVGKHKGMAESLHQDIVRHGIRDNQKIDLVVDCLDNAEARNFVNKFCIQRRLPLVHVGLGGVATGVGEVVWRPMSYATNQEDIRVCTHELGRSIICLTVALATLSIDRFLENGDTVDYMVNSSGKVMF